MQMTCKNCVDAIHNSLHGADGMYDYKNFFAVNK